MINRLTLIEYSGSKFISGKKRKCALYKCECGSVVEKVMSDVNTNNTRSCGCLHKEILIKNNRINKSTHRKTKTRKYSIWKSMKKRCLDSNSVHYNNYGGRGIIMCDEWLRFENFDKDMPDPPTELHTLDRIDNNKGYFKENCKWSTSLEQANHRRDNNIITYNNKTQTLSEWAKELGVRQSFLWNRIYGYKWPIEKALTTPVRKLNKC